MLLARLLGPLVIGAVAVLTIGMRPTSAQTSPEIAIIPPHGRCSQPIHITGHGFMPSARVTLLREEHFSQASIRTFEASPSGEVDIVLAAESLRESCHPGAEYRFSAWQTGPSGEHRPRARAVYTIDAPWTLSAHFDSSAGQPIVIVEGSGFPPGLTMMIACGAADALAHDFAVIGEVETDQGGELVAAVPLVCRGDITGEAVGIYVSPADPDDNDPLIRAKAVLSFGPAPPGSGNGGLASLEEHAGVTTALALVVAAIVLVAVARRTSLRSR